MTTTPRLVISDFVDSAAGNEALGNLAHRVLEALLCGQLEDSTLTTAPGSPTDGQVWKMAGIGGAWAAFTSGNLAIYLTGVGWQQRTPKGGMKFFDKQAKEDIAYSSVESAWYPLQLRWSTTEYWTGRYQGSNKVYAKVLAAVNMPNASVATTAHGITAVQLSKHIEILGTATDGTISFPFAQFVSMVGLGLDAWLDATNLNLASTGDQTIYTADVLLLYCR